MARSLKKGPFVSPKLLIKLSRVKNKEKETIKTWCRACTITPEMIGFHFAVHNGKKFLEVQVTEDMVGHKLGEFSPTTKFVRHGGKIQRGLEKSTITKKD